MTVYKDGCQVTKWVAYNQDGFGEYWMMRGVYFNGGPEIANPVSFGSTRYGVWNPLETMEIEVHINATVTEFESIIITLPGGFRAT